MIARRKHGVRLVVQAAITATALSALAGGDVATAPKDPAVQKFVKLLMDNPTSDGPIMNAADAIPVSQLGETGKWLLGSMQASVDSLEKSQSDLDKGAQKSCDLSKKQRIPQAIAAVRDVLLPAAKDDHQQLDSELALLGKGGDAAQDTARVKHLFNMMAYRTLQAVRLQHDAQTAVETCDLQNPGVTSVTLENTQPTTPDTPEETRNFDPESKRPPEASPFL